MLVNVVDVPPLCNFILPAIVRTGPLAVAISTAGRLAGAGQADEARDRRAVRRALRRARGAAQRRARLGQGDAADLPGPQGVLRVDRQRRPRPDRAAARPARATRVAPPDRRGAQRTSTRRRERDRRRAAHAEEVSTRQWTRRRGSPTSTPTAAPRMVDVGDKPVTDRRALARAVRRGSAADRRARARPATRPRATCSASARIAGIQAAKRTAELIPLCHPLPLDVRRRRGRGRRRRGRDRARSPRPARPRRPASRWRR